MDKFRPDGIYIYIYIYICMYVCMYIYIQSWKQYSFLVITTMALWQLMHCEIWAFCVSWITSDHLYKYMHYINIYTHTNTHTHNIYVFIYIYIYICIYIHLYIYTYIYTHTYIYIKWIDKDVSRKYFSSNYVVFFTVITLYI